MDIGRIKINTLLSSDNPTSVGNWIALLNIFTQYKHDLDIDTVQCLVHGCEQCRIAFNAKHANVINKTDVNPDIYAHLNVLELQNNYNKESLPTILVAVAQ